MQYITVAHRKFYIFFMCIMNLLPLMSFFSHCLQHYAQNLPLMNICYAHYTESLQLPDKFCMKTCLHTNL